MSSEKSGKKIGLSSEIWKFRRKKTWFAPIRNLGSSALDSDKYTTSRRNKSIEIRSTDMNTISVVLCGGKNSFFFCFFYAVISFLSFIPLSPVSSRQARVRLLIHCSSKRLIPILFGRYTRFLEAIYYSIFRFFAPPPPPQ